MGGKEEWKWGETFSTKEYFIILVFIKTEAMMKQCVKSLLKKVSLFKLLVTFHSFQTPYARRHSEISSMSVEKKLDCLRRRNIVQI